MSNRRWRSWRGRACLLLLCWFALAGPVQAQAVSESVVKAGFLLNFIKFTQWTSVRERLVVCSPSGQVLSGQFARLQGRAVGPRILEVRLSVGSGEWRSCDLLYLTEADASRADVILRALANSPVLTVGDFPDFVHMGGMMGLRLEDSRIRFDVNLVAVERAGLLLNSQMVQLAGRVIR